MKWGIVVFTVMAAAFTPAARGGAVLGKTSWGDWGPAQHCDGGAYVTGFRLKVEPKQGEGDDTALNGIEFVCSNGSHLTSKVGPWGTWNFWQNCPSGQEVNGFSFRSQPAQGRGDDTAGNDLNLRCSDGSWLYGEGLNWGEWESAYCMCNYRVCGLRTRVEAIQGRADDTALNQVELICCPLPC